MSEVDIFNKGLSDLVENVNRWSKFDPSTNYQRTITYPPQVQNVNNTVDDPNIMVSFVRTNGEYNYASMWQAHIELLEGARLCYGLYDAKVYVGNVDTGETVKNLVLLGYSRNGITQNYFIDNVNTVYGATSQQNGRMVETDNNGRNVYSVSGATQSWRGVSFESFGISLNAWRNLADYYKQYIIDHLTPTDDTLKNSVNTIQASINDIVIGGSSSYNWFNGLWFEMGKSGRHAQSFTYQKLPFPVFDITDTEHIIAYLNTGNRTGEIDIFDTNPKKKEIEDMSTNYKVFLTPSEKTKTKFSVIAYNNELIPNFDTLGHNYGLTVSESTGAGTFNEVNTSPMTKYPTVTFIKSVPTDYTLALVFRDKENPAIKSPSIFIYLQSASTREVNAEVTQVINGVDTCTKSNILDGYRYTAPNGEWVDVIFRAPSLDDLNENYPNDEDTEDDSTGTNTDAGISNGMLTYNISTAQFNTINNKMWSTDWTNVFKSNTIDPIKCVITCKSMPFTATALSSGDVTIANLNTGVHANTVKQVKSFTTSTLLMPTYNKDFTDLRSRVHLWLPYIGWQDLPAVEVMSRASVNGLEAHLKRLGFKYIVDFVDGNCRCIVSVNGTERWVFDGNCAIDIPLTSDNHTNAISNAIRAGVGAVMSIGGAVASGYAGNPVGVVGGVVSAVQNGANAFPTYSYSTSCSPSGYIEASMNQSIMVIIERPSEMLPENFAHVHGRPCRRVTTLGAMSGFTQCSNVNVSGIDATPSERIAIKSLLESGVYL